MMRISEVISVLSELKDQYGDLPVVSCPNIDGENLNLERDEPIMSLYKAEELLANKVRFVDSIMIS